MRNTIEILLKIYDIIICLEILKFNTELNFFYNKDLITENNRNIDIAINYLKQYKF